MGFFVRGLRYTHVVGGALHLCDGFGYGDEKLLSKVGFGEGLCGADVELCSDEIDVLFRVVLVWWCPFAH